MKKKRRIPAYVQQEIRSQKLRFEKMGPREGIRVNTSKLSYGGAWYNDVPEYWLPETVRCSACGSDFEITPADKRYIYEVLRLDILSVINRCRACQSEYMKVKKLAKMNFSRSLKSLGKGQLREMLENYKKYLRFGGNPSHAFVNAIMKRLDCN
jgi:hypothetical protein